jgi:hypothetical protein
MAFDDRKFLPGEPQSELPVMAVMTGGRYVSISPPAQWGRLRNSGPHVNTSPKTGLPTQRRFSATHFRGLLLDFPIS